MGRYLDKDDPQAEELLERLLGYSHAITTYTEEYVLDRKHSQIKLCHDPLEMMGCRGYVKIDEMFVNGWEEINLEAINQIGAVLDIPPSLFGVKYRKVEVTYTAGELETPDDLRDAANEISDLLAKQNINAWNIPLSENTLITIGKYKKQRGEGIK